MAYKYLNIYNTIKSDILTGKIQYGTKIETEFELMKRFDCSQLTAKNAVKKLVAEGLVERKAHNGTFCIYSKRHFENGKIKIILHTKGTESSLFLNGIAEQLSRFNIGCDPYYIYFNKHNQEKELQNIADAGYIGLIIDPALEASSEEVFVNLLKAKFPFVVYDTFSKSMTYNTVCSNGFKGQFDITEYLIQRGHTKIAYYSNYTKFSPIMRQRYDGYLEALRIHNLPINRRNIFLIEKNQYIYLQKDAYQTFAARILEKENKFSAIVCGNDSLALSLIYCAKQRGLHLPAKFSVVGFDDLDGAKNSDPPLTTVAQPYYMMGKECANILIENIVKGSNRTVQMYVDGTIIERKSVKSLLK